MLKQTIGMKWTDTTYPCFSDAVSISTRKKNGAEVVLLGYYFLM